MNAILLGVDGQAAVQHIDPAALRILLIGSFDAVSLGSSRNRCVIEHDGIFSANGIALAFNDDVGVGYRQAALTDETIFKLGGNLQRACAVHKQIGLGKQCAVWLILAIGQSIKRAVGKHTLFPFGQGYDHFVCRFNMHSRAVQRGDADIIQQKIHICPRRIDYKLPGAASVY